MQLSLRNRVVRKASLPADAEGIMQVFSAAKAIMVSTGNANQWREGYPSLEVVRSDIERNGSYVIEQDGRIVAYFAFLASPDPTYATIYDGNWLNDTQPYHVIHRIASYPDVHGIFDSIIEFCSATEPNLRIDTHRDNRIMQHVIEKHGFSYCGIIHIATGDERLAYQSLLCMTRIEPREQREPSSSLEWPSRGRGSRRQREKQTVRKMKDAIIHGWEKVKRWLQSLSFRTGVIVLLCCLPFYILSFAQMLLPISAAAKGVLWTILFGLAKTCQYGGLTILGVEGYNRLKNRIKRKKE